MDGGRQPVRLLAARARYINPYIRISRRKAAHSHINIIALPAEDNLLDNSAEPDTFVRRSSLQEEIDLGLAISSKLDAFSSHTQSTPRPRTFAEATMSTRQHQSINPRTRLGSDRHDNKMADSPIAETFGPGKIVLKKKKKGSKWHRLDLSGSVPADNEAEDEASSNPASSAPTRASTPNLMLTSDLSRSPPPTSFEPLSITTSDCANTHPLSQEHTAALNIKKKSEISEGNTGSENRPDSESEFEGFAADSFEVQHPAVSGSFRLSNTYSDQPYSAGLHSTPTQAGIASSLSFADSEYIDNHPTPRVAQGGFPASFESHNSLSETDWATFDDIDRSDTQSTKDRTEAVLAQLSASIMVNNGRDVVLDDVFDSADWDPEMPKGPSPTASPELMPLGLKPVAYTTVGSLVDPSNIPQFSAPNRIQREGANRRPVPLSMMQLRQFDSSFYNQQRGPPPPLNMSNSMQYAQQLGRNPSNSTMPSSAESQSSGSAMSRSMSGHMPERSSEYDSLGPQELTEREELSLAQQLNIQESYCYGSTSYDDGNKPLFKVMPTVDENRNVHSVRVFPDDNPIMLDMLDEDARRRSHSYHGSLQGMDKMQTLQRLSKFENPMQEACRNRLAELSVKGKPANGSASLTPYDIAVQDQNSAMYSSTEEAPIEKLIVNIGLGRGGELNRSYQFPPPGLATNPLLASFSNSALQQAFIQPRPPGYPQPLTAGPPRRSQFPAGLGSIGAPQSNSQQVQQMENSADGTKPKAGISIAPPVPTNSHYHKAGAMGGAPPLLIENRSYPSTKIQDTLSAQDAMMRYYPNGLPPDFNYKWNPISSENAKLIGERVPTEEERNAARLKGQQDWFYQGQRRYATMKGQDHIEELEMRNKQTDKFGNIAPPKPINHAVIPAFITPEQARNISTSEATIPLLDATFGTLLAYAEASNSSRSRLSKFVTPDAHLIDASPTGNDSSFGEDWGPPGGQRGSRASVSVANSSRASSIAASSRGGGVKISLFERFNSGKHGKN